MAQNEASNWYFGENAGIRFNPINNSVSAVDGGRLNTREGCASISDESGNLLFYTDGITVYDRNHNVMPGGNGLFGHPSSSQSALIVPKPQDANIYYIFTVGAQLGQGTDQGFNYSTVDMSQNGGLGSVTLRNRRLLQNTSEKLSAVLKDCRDESIWVLTYAAEDGISDTNNTFYAYEVNPSGVNTIPVTTRVNTTNATRGYLKISPDGTKIAAAHMGAGETPRELFIYDFDAATGNVSNQQALFLNTPYNSPYGLEFSPNSQLLYVHSSNDYFARQGEPNGPEQHFSALTQFNIQVADIEASEVLLDQRNLYRGALQLGPDGRIYRALSESYQVGLPYLGIIQYPNVQGTGANYRHNAVSVSPNNSSQGLPPFIQSFFSTKVDIIGSGATTGTKNLELCEGEEYLLKIEPIDGAIYTWMRNNVVLSETSNNLLVNESGHYELFIDPNNGDCSIEGEAYVTVNENPIALDTSLFQCDEDGIFDGLTIFNLNEAHGSLTNNEQNRTTKFYLTQEDANNNINELEASSFQNTTYPQVLYVKVIDDITRCYSYSELTLDVSATSATNGEIIGCDNDGLEDGFTQFDLSLANDEVILGITNDVDVKYYETYENALLEINELPYNYTNTTPYFQTLYVRVENDNACYGINTVNLTVNELPDISEDEELNFCLNYLDLIIPVDAGLIQNNPADFEYLWSTGETTHSILIDAPGEYEVTVINPITLCEKSRTISVIPSNIATIDNIEVVDATTNNTITIIASGEGDYEYSFNNPNGPYQDSNFFENVPAGLHNVYVRDKNNCGTVSDIVSVIGFPKFFTPNNDGYHDDWHVYGINDPDHFESKIYIYDRYGKLLKELSPRGSGWDGTFNGYPLPTSDYWFFVKLQDGRIFRSHFTLKR